MKTYHINVSPCPGIGIGYVVPGESENHALSVLSYDLRMVLKLIRVKIEHGNHSEVGIWQGKRDRAEEVLKTVRRPGRVNVRKNSFGVPDSLWPKITVVEITRAITSAYVQEVWLRGA